MTFASAIVKQSSERSFLARITPKRNITSTLVLVSGTEYSVTLPYNAKRVTLNGIDLTEITSGATATGQFKYDQATQTLLVNTATAPNVTTGVVIAFYRIYLCTGAGTVACDDPTTSTGLPQQWEPRLSDSPSIGSFFTDALQGVFSFTDITLNVVNGDSWFSSFIAATDSFNLASVAVWYFIDGVANIQRMYTGSVSKITTGSQVSLTVSDSFNRLRVPCYLGDTDAECYLRTSTYPDMDAAKNGTPWRFVTGESSPYGKRRIGIPFNPLDIEELDESIVNEAVCLTALTPGRSANRNWSMVRSDGAFLTAYNGFTTLDTVLDLGDNQFFVKVTGTNANYRVGETFTWQQDGFTFVAHVAKAGTFYYGEQTFVAGNVNIGTDRITLTAHGMATGERILLSGTLPSGLVSQTVYYVNVINANLIEVCASLSLAISGTQINLTTTGSGTMTCIKLDSGVEYNLALLNAVDQNQPYLDSDPEDHFDAGVATSVNVPAIAAILRVGSEPYYATCYLRFDADYDISFVNTSSGNVSYQFRFKELFERNLQEDTVLPNVSTTAGDQPSVSFNNTGFAVNPTQNKVFYSIRFDGALSHGDLLKKMATAVGLTPLVSSFTAADAALVADSYMQIPLTSESDYTSYIEYAQAVLRSTLGYLTVNAAGEIVYDLIDAPTPASTIQIENAVLNGIDIDYTMIAMSMIFFNEDLPDLPDIVESSSICRYLHETENVVRFPHVLDDISARTAAIFNLRKNRYALYRHSVAHTESIRALGDDVTITSPDVLGGSGTVAAKITGLTKGADAIEVESTDLLSS